MQADHIHGPQSGKADSLESEWVPDNEVIWFLRCTARVLGVLLAGFFLLMFIGASSGSRRPSSPGIKPMTLVGLTPAFSYAIAMFLALKWERAGAKLGGASQLLVVTIVALFPHGGVPHSGDTLEAIWAGIIGLAFSLPVILYGLCWWLEGRDRKRYKAGL